MPDTINSSILKANFLGKFTLTRQDDQKSQSFVLTNPPTVKSQSLLAFLIYHRDQSFGRERLMDMYWADSPAHRARRSLSTALWHIRQCFPNHDPIQANSMSIQLLTGGVVELDIDIFEKKVRQGTFSDLQDAIAIYKGNFLDGFYDDWVIRERFRLESLFIEALSKLMVLQEEASDLNLALSTAHQLMEIDSLREDAHRLLMRVYCAMGQRNTALEQYHLCCRILREELDVDPMPETSKLYQDIHGGQYEIGPVSPVVVTPLSLKSNSTGSNPLDIIAQEVLVGRERELGFLNEQWEKARAGQGRLIVVNGEVGVGKTHLLDKFTGILRSQGIRGLWGKCYEFERQLPYQPIAEALRPALLDLSSEDLGNIPEWVLAEMGKLVPELLTIQPKGNLDVSTSIGQEQAHLFAGVAKFLNTLSASSPLLLVLEDLNWATDSTLELVHYLARHLTTSPILLVGSFRPDITGEKHPQEAFQQLLNNEGLSQTLLLLPLSSTATEQLVQTLSGLDKEIIPLAQGLYKETEGNPFFMVETLKALFEMGEIKLVDGTWQGDFDRTSRNGLPLPVRVSEVIQSRIHRLGNTTQDILRIAAVLGSDFDFDLLTAIWGRDEEIVLDALDEMLRHQIIVDGNGIIDRDYVFTHHKIQEVVYADITVQRRQYLHVRAGLEMEKSFGAQANELAGELAFHFWQGRSTNKESVIKAAHYLLLAGDRALNIHANQDGIRYFEQAVPLLQQMGDNTRTAETYLKLGQIYHTAMDFQHSQQAYKTGFALRQRSDIPQTALSNPEPPHPLRIDWCGMQQELPDLTLIEGQNWDGVVEQLFSGLVALDEKMSIIPDVSHSWEILDSGQQYVFHLRDDVFWSDGSPVTAIDFVYALRRMLDPAVESPFANLFLDIQGARSINSGQERNLECLGVKAPQPNKLIIDLEQPTGHMLHLLAQSSAFPIPHHVLDAHGSSWTDGANIVTNGPFQLQSWDPGCQMTLIQNTSYHGRVTGNVEQVDLIWCKNERSRLEMYAAGELDVLDLGRLSAAEMEKARQQYPDEYISNPWPSTNIVRFNTQYPPFNNSLVRQAFAHSINQHLMAEDALAGFEIPAKGGFIPPGTPGHSAGIGLPFDPDYARKLLDQAGYPGGNGLPPIPLYSNISFVAHASYLQKQWQKELGITILPEVVTLPELADLIQQDQPFIFIIGWLADYPDPDNFLRLGLQRFTTQWQNSDFEILIVEARKIADHTERMALYARADKILINDAPIVPLTYWPLHLLVKPWVRQYPISAGKFWFWKDTILDLH
jgi:ABC-type oligopeptide transport system substrate-binding subunit/DNA-binding SARP family transcriptional activator